MEPFSPRPEIKGRGCEARLVGRALRCFLRPLQVGYLVLCSRFSINSMEFKRLNS